MKEILITGATKGIGRACAEAFAREGWRITGVARTEADLAQMAVGWRKEFPRSQLEVITADLATKAGTDLVPARDYDVVLLNAAVFRPGHLLDADHDYFEGMLALNVLGNQRLARRLLPPMVADKKGHLVVIGSTGTDNWKGHMTAYVATKYALRGLFLGWQKDLKGTGVLATLVAPGATLTASWDNEVPPPGILQPAEVAEVVMEAVRQKRTGRIVV